GVAAARAARPGAQGRAGRRGGAGRAAGARERRGVRGRRPPRRGEGDRLGPARGGAEGLMPTPLHVVLALAAVFSALFLWGLLQRRPDPSAALRERYLKLVRLSRP